MNAVICVTNAGRVIHTDPGVFGGNKGSTAGNELCHTHGGTLSNRSLPLRACSVRAYLEAARAPQRVAGVSSTVTGSEVSR